MTKENDKRKDIPRQYRHHDKADGKAIDLGSTQDFAARMDWRFYDFLQKIMGFAAWDGKNWIKPNFTNLSNPIESQFENTIASNLEIRDELVNQKLIYQSEDYYWTKALEYQKYLEDGGKDLTQPNPNIHKTEWIEDPAAKPIKVLINNETGEAFQVPVEEK